MRGADIGVVFGGVLWRYASAETLMSDAEEALIQPKCPFCLAEDLST